MDKLFYKTYFEVEQNHWWFRVRRNIILSLVEKYQIPKTAKILDFGCGFGYTVGHLQKLGYDASGIDVSAEAIEYGLSKHIEKLAVIKNETAELLKEHFDLVLALDVVEHIEDDLSAVKNLENFLKPGGIAIITVPAYQFLWGIQDDISHHYRRYTLVGLSRLVKENTDFSIIRKSYFNTFLFLPIALVRLLNRIFKFEKRESDFDINNRPLNTLFYLIFNLEVNLLKHLNFPFGVSILLILKKGSLSA